MDCMTLVERKSVNRELGRERKKKYLHTMKQRRKIKQKK